MVKTRRLFLLVALVVLVTGALTGCAPTAATTATEAATEVPAVTPKVGGTVVIGVTEEPDTLDEQQSQFSVTDMVVSMMGAALVSKDVDGNYVPYSAKSWETSEDGLTWTFHLREDMKFHNGDPVTAKDWLYTFTRMRDPEIISPVSAGMVTAVDTFAAPDDYTLVMTLKEPFYPLLANLTSAGYLGVISQRAVEELGDKYGTTEGGFVGAGPYVFKEWIQDEKIVLERNPDYVWGPKVCSTCNTSAYYLQTLEFRIIPDYATILAGLEAGEISYTNVVYKDLATIEATGLFQTISYPTPAVRFLEFNVTKPPFDDQNARLGLNYAIDRKAIVDVVLSGQGVKTLTPLSPAMLGYSAEAEAIAPDYDVEKAKAAFAAAGYTLNADNKLEKDGQIFEITISAIQSEELMKAAQIIVSQLEAVGVTAKIESSEFGSLAEQLTQGNFTVDTMGYGWPDSDILFYQFSTKGGGWANAHDETLDTMLDLCRTELDPAKHNQATLDALNYINEHAYMVSLYSPNGFVVVDKNITGVTYSPFVGLMLQDAFFTNLP